MLGVCGCATGYMALAHSLDSLSSHCLPRPSGGRLSAAVKDSALGTPDRTAPHRTARRESGTVAPHLTLLPLFSTSLPLLSHLPLSCPPCLLHCPYDAFCGALHVCWVPSGPVVRLATWFGFSPHCAAPRHPILSAPHATARHSSQHRTTMHPFTPSHTPMRHRTAAQHPPPPPLPRPTPA